jgi:PAS domain S-box-containing protein
MNKDEPLDRKNADLRRRAERLVRRLSSDQDVQELSHKDVSHLVHELQVHQTEMEMQNDELRRAQLELEDSRDKYADLYDFAPVGYITLNKSGTILDVNLAGAIMVKRERRFLVRKPFLSLVAEKDLPIFLSHLRQVFQLAEKHSCELQLKLPGEGDSSIHVKLESISLQREGQEPPVCRTAMSDITDIKRTEEDLLDLQANVLNGMAEGVCVCDEKGIVSFTNPALDSMLGFGPGELLGKQLGDLEKCADGEGLRISDLLQRAVLGGTFQEELQCEKKDGTSIDVRLHIVAARLFHKISVVVIWQDVTELKNAERNLLNSDLRFRAIFECANDVIYLKDRSLRYTHVNPAFEKLLDKPATDIVGFDYEQLFGKEGSGYDKDVDTRVLDGQTVEEEFVKRVRGTLVRLHEVRVPIRDSQGRVAGICGIARDITERSERALVPHRKARPPASPNMRDVLQLALRVAKQTSVVLLRGESGSGKDHLARLIHDHSERSGGPYFSINCAAVAPDLAETELFGHERGSFTGAHARKRGLLELAEGGTLLLNEIGDLSLPLQAKLLTFLDTRKILRVGAQKEIAVNARLIAATNKNLEAEVSAGRFRQDLYYRLGVVVIEVPPLRERIEDLPDLIDELVGKLAQDLQLSHIPHIDPEVIQAFQRYRWPGNVRELRNVLERLLILGELPPICDHLATDRAPRGDYTITLRFAPGRTLRDLTDEITRALCIEALRRSHGNKKEAARILGIARDSLYRHLKHFDIDVPD